MILFYSTLATSFRHKMKSKEDKDAKDDKTKSADSSTGIKTNAYKPKNITVEGYISFYWKDGIQ